MNDESEAERKMEERIKSLSPAPIKSPPVKSSAVNSPQHSEEVPADPSDAFDERLTSSHTKPLQKQRPRKIISTRLKVRGNAEVAAQAARWRDAEDVIMGERWDAVDTDVEDQDILTWCTNFTREIRVELPDALGDEVNSLNGRSLTLMLNPTPCV